MGPVRAHKCWHRDNQGFAQAALAQRLASIVSIPCWSAHLVISSAACGSSSDAHSALPFADTMLDCCLLRAGVPGAARGATFMTPCWSAACCVQASLAQRVALLPRHHVGLLPAACRRPWRGAWRYFHDTMLVCCVQASLARRVALLS